MNRSTPVQFIKFVLALGAISAMTACSGDSSGRVSYEQVKQVTNILPPEGLQHTDAVVLLSNAGDERSLTTALNSIKTDTANNFDWPRFWSELSLNNGIQNKLTPRTRSQLFHLHRFSCTKESFAAFSNFVLINLGELSEADFELFVGKDRLCKQPIGESLTKVALARLKEGLQDLAPSGTAIDAGFAAQAESRRGHRARLIAEMIRLEYELALAAGEKEADEDAFNERWKDILSSISTEEWVRVGAALTIHGRTREALQILDMHKRYSSESTYTRLKRRVLYAYTQNTNLIEDAIEELGLPLVARLFQSATPDQFGRRPEMRTRTMQTVLSTLSKAALNESTLPLDLEDRWEEALRRLSVLRRTERSMGEDLGGEFSLRLMERMLQWAEPLFQGRPGQAVDYLEGKESNFIYWEIYYLRMRLLARARGSLAGFPREHMPDHIRRTETSIIDRYLQSYVAAYYEHATPSNVLIRIAKLCAMLTNSEFAAKSLTLTEAKSNNEMLSSLNSHRGCLRVTVSPEEAETSPVIQITARDTDITPPLLQVVILDGINLSLHVRSLMGGLFDLSATTGPPIADAPDTEGEPIIAPTPRHGGSLSLNLVRFESSILPAFTSEAKSPAQLATNTTIPSQNYNGKLYVQNNGVPVQ